jgi:hypothetical protein
MKFAPQFPRDMSGQYSIMLKEHSKNTGEHVIFRVHNLHIICLVLLISFYLHAEPRLPQSQENNIISYDAGSTLLWGVGATLVPLTYIFLPVTYARKLSDSWAFSQFTMYRFEHYDNPKNTWHKFHELFVLPGIRYSFDGQFAQGLYLSMHLGGGFGLGPNLKFASLNAHSEFGYNFPTIYKNAFLSLNFGLLSHFIVMSTKPHHRSYSWSESNFIGKISHLLTPLGFVNIGVSF